MIIIMIFFSPLKIKKFKNLKIYLNFYYYLYTQIKNKIIFFFFFFLN